MIIDGIEYIKKEEAEKVKAEDKKQKDFIITDICNVSGIVPIPKDKDLDVDIIEIDGLGSYKEYKEDIYYQVDFKNKKRLDKVIICKSKYSYEFINVFVKIAELFGYDRTPQFYMKIDDNKVYVNDNPILVKFDRIVFILAPRVENGD